MSRFDIVGRSANSKRGSTQPQEREAQARQRAASRTRSASAAARSLKNAKRKRGSAQPQEREAQARQRAASRTRSASAAARSLKKRNRPPLQCYSLCCGQSFSVQREQTAPCLLGLWLVVDLRIRRAPAVCGAGVHFDLRG